MKAVIEKFGSSLALRIPRAFLQQAKVKSGSSVCVTVKKGRMVVTAMKVEELSLQELLANVTPQNIHPEIDWGAPRGKEVW